MSHVKDHYDNLLTEHYTWMFGDFDDRLSSTRAFFEEHHITSDRSRRAADLGCGPGFQSIPLAEVGFQVVAIDTSRKLLDELKQKKNGLLIEAVEGDLRQFRKYIHTPLEVCVCMGDTLTHLDSLDDVARLLRSVYASLDEGGRLVLTFRDMTHELNDQERFIPVRSDIDKIFTCVLEYEQTHVKVHDLVYTHQGDNWQLNKSQYKKLKIPFDWIKEQIESLSFQIEKADNTNGLITIIAQRT